MSLLPAPLPDLTDVRLEPGKVLLLRPDAVWVLPAPGGEWITAIETLIGPRLDVE